MRGNSWTIETLCVKSQFRHYFCIPPVNCLVLNTVCNAYRSQLGEVQPTRVYGECGIVGRLLL
jgi:hypothetical protein